MWNHGFTNSPGLEKLGIMTIRLMRMVLYDKLQCNQTQLRALGIENDMAEAFKAETIKEIVKTRKQRDKRVKFIVLPRSDF
jgi:hypothetical protein